MYPYLQGQQKQERFHTVVATVDEVTEKQVVSVGALASNLEQLNQIVELTMNITTDLHEKNGNQNKKEQKREKALLRQRTVTGASTFWTLLSSIRISLALSHKAFTSDSFKYSQRFKRSICSSRFDIALMIRIRPGFCFNQKLKKFQPQAVRGKEIKSRWDTRTNCEKAEAFYQIPRVNKLAYVTLRDRAPNCLSVKLGQRLFDGVARVAVATVDVN